MSILIIQHEGAGDPARFKVVRVRGANVNATPEAAEVAPPHGFPVEGRPDSDLMAELRWYLEQFLGYPFEPETDHAERVQKALRAWGGQAFSSLFGAGQGRDFYSDAVRYGGGPRSDARGARTDAGAHRFGLGRGSRARERRRIARRCSGPRRAFAEYRADHSARSGP